MSIPFIKRDKVFFYKNDGLQNQSVLYVKEDIDDSDSLASVVIDPNKFSKDGTVALSGIYFSNHNNYLGYSVSKSGSDWREFYVKNLSTGKDLNDHLKWIKFSGMSWSGDGFYYNAFPIPEEGKELSQANQSSKVYYHKLGTVQDEDILIFSDIDNPKISPYSSTTSDGRFLMIYRTKGTYGNSLMVKDLDQPDSRFITVINDYKSETSVVDHINGKLLAITDRNAGKKKVVLIDINNPKESEWKTLIPENKNVLTSVNMIDQKLVAHYMSDIISEWVIFNLDGKIINKVDLPGPGISYGFSGDKDQSVS